MWTSIGLEGAWYARQFELILDSCRATVASQRVRPTVWSLRIFVAV